MPSLKKNTVCYKEKKIISYLGEVLSTPTRAAHLTHT